MILADKIIELRKKNGWSQEELAEQLGVSRQAVSKWEGAQSTPDLERVLGMSKLFGVSTDYLLRDEMEAETAPVAEDVGESAIRRVSMEEANEYLQLRRAAAPRIALATAMCIISPVPLLALGALATAEVIGETAAAALGLVALLAMVTVAVLIFIMTGMRSSAYEYLEKEPIETAYGVTGMVREQLRKQQDCYMRGTVIGVGLCILSVLPLLCAALLEKELWMLGSVCLLLTIVAAGVNLLIRVGVVHESCQKLLEEGDYTRAHKRAANSPWTTAYWCVTTALYLAYSFITNDWGRSWIVWPVAGVLYGVVYIFASHRAEK